MVGVVVARPSLWCFRAWVALRFPQRPLCARSSPVTLPAVPAIPRTDRFGFIILDNRHRPVLAGSNQSGSPRGDRPSVEPATPMSTDGLLKDGTDSTSIGDTSFLDDGEAAGGGGGGGGAGERPYDGPPPSSSSGAVIPRFREMRVPTTAKELKEYRANLLIENNRIKKWMAMFAKWDLYVAAAPSCAASRPRGAVG
jgi:hypothetical protein